LIKEPHKTKRIYSNPHGTEKIVRVIGVILRESNGEGEFGEIGSSY